MNKSLLTITIVLLAALLLFVATEAKKSPHQHKKRHYRAYADAEYQCDCSWASPSSCGNSDGSYCHQQCCGSRPAPTPSPAPSPSGGCDCSWASASACATSDGSYCNQQCCGNRPSPSPSPPSGYEGVAKTTRYWDCCKPSCAWPSNVPGGRTFVRSCLRNGISDAPSNSPNICGGGGAPGGPNFMCNNQQPFTMNGVLYGFAASNVDCCTCYELLFKDTALAGQRMIVQVTNKGGDLSSNHFDLQIPGGGLGIFDGCTPQFGQWNGGARYGGISSADQCRGLPQALQSGCYWRFNDFKNADNPNVHFKRVTCPSVLTSITGCRL